jgi:hypothetical protein
MLVKYLYINISNNYKKNAVLILKTKTQNTQNNTIIFPIDNNILIILTKISHPKNFKHFFTDYFSKKNMIFILNLLLIFFYLKTILFSLYILAFFVINLINKTYNSKLKPEVNDGKNVQMPDKFETKGNDGGTMLQTELDINKIKKLKEKITIKQKNKSKTTKIQNKKKKIKKKKLKICTIAQKKLIKNKIKLCEEDGCKKNKKVVKK